MIATIFGKLTLESENAIITSNYVGPDFSSVRYVGSLLAQPISPKALLSSIFLKEEEELNLPKKFHLSISLSKIPFIEILESSLLHGSIRMR